MPGSAKKTASKTIAKGKPAARPAGKKILPSKPAAAARRAKARTPKPATQPTILHSLHALLETVRTIAQYEDQLCTLTHEARSAGTLSPEAQDELHELLLELPSSVYHAELDGVHEALHNLTSPAHGSRPRSRRLRR